MSIIMAAVGEQLKEFGADEGIEAVWAFVDSAMATADNQKAIVLMDDGGDTIGCIWDRSMYYAHWETPSKMLAYFELTGFDTGE